MAFPKTTCDRRLADDHHHLEITTLLLIDRVDPLRR